MVKNTTHPSSRESSSRAVQLLTSIYLSFSLEFIVSSDQRFSFNFDLTVFLQFEITKITTLGQNETLHCRTTTDKLNIYTASFGEVLVFLFFLFTFVLIRFICLLRSLKFYTFSKTIFTTPTNAIPLLLFRLSITIVIIGRTRRLSSLSLRI